MSGAQSAADGVAGAAKRARGPILAGGAALAGVAGAAVVATRASSRRKVLGITLPRRKGLSLPGRRSGLKGDVRDVASAVGDAAKRADRLGQRVSRVASSVQQATESVDEAAKKA